MKKLTAMLLIGILFLAGCQSTPEKPIVQGKDSEQLIDTAKSDASGKTIIEMLNVPDKLEVSAADGSGRTTVNANAEIIIPDVQGISITRVKERNFTQAEADRILAYFIGDSEFNDRYKAGYSSEIERLIFWKSELAKETDPQKRADLQASIEKFESAGFTVPDGPQEIEPASRILAHGEQAVSQIFGYSALDGNNRFLNIINNPVDHENTVVYTSEKNGYAMNPGDYYYENMKQNVEKVGFDPATLSQAQLNMTKEAAEAKAQEALLALGIDGMALATIDDVWGGTRLEGGVAESQARHAYKLRYTRSVNGTPTTYTDNKIVGNMVEVNEMTNETFSYDWRYECVQFVIDDTGIVEFVWESPYDVVETVVESAALKQFDEIESVFSKMILVTNVSHQEGVSISFNISRAQLGLTRVMEKDKYDSALLIPVWDFFGTLSIEYTDSNGQKQTDTLDEIHTSQLTINAIDGSIIDRTRGY